MEINVKGLANASVVVEYYRSASVLPVELYVKNTHCTAGAFYSARRRLLQKGVLIKGGSGLVLASEHLSGEEWKSVYSSKKPRKKYQPRKKVVPLSIEEIRAAAESALGHAEEVLVVCKEIEKKALERKILVAEHEKALAKLDGEIAGLEADLARVRSGQGAGQEQEHLAALVDFVKMGPDRRGLIVDYEAGGSVITKTEARALRL